MGGIPTVYLPKELMDRAASGADANAAMQVQTWKNIVTNVRIDEQMGLLLPSDIWEGSSGSAGGGAAQYRFELTVPKGGRGQAVDSDKAITRYNINMMSSVLADFIQLGHQSRGTQSLATSKVDMFFQAMEGFLNSNADVMNRYGIPRLSDLNGLDPEGNPTIHPDMPQRQDLDVLSNFILRLSQAGMPLFPNETLQEYLSDAAGMPDISEDDDFGLVMDASRAAAEAESIGQVATPEFPATNENKTAPTTDLQKRIAASIARRIMHMGGSATSYGKKRRRVRP
jgi:hypothetical protein